MTALEIIRFILSAVCTLASLFVIVTGVLGVFRFRGALSRMHAAALIDTVGLLLMVAGLVIGEGFTVTSGKLLVLVLILWLTSPVSSHLLSRMEVTINDKLHKAASIQDEDMIRREKEGL